MSPKTKKALNVTVSVSVGAVITALGSIALKIAPALRIPPVTLGQGCALLAAAILIGSAGIVLALGRLGVKFGQYTERHNARIHADEQLRHTIRDILPYLPKLDRILTHLESHSA